LTLSELIADFRAKVEPIIGETGLSDPRENIADPLVQAVIHPLGGLAELWQRLEKFQDGFDIRTADCDCLEWAASLVGETKRTNQPTRASIVFTGSDGTVIPANTEFQDGYAGSWNTESAIMIRNGFGFGVARSAVGNFEIAEGELSLTTPIAGVALATNIGIIEQGYLTESCEQFRGRLLSQEKSIETEYGVLNQLKSITTKAWFINDAPDCISPVSNSGFVVIGGNDNEIAETIRQYAPMNYTRLAGGVQIDFNCEPVRFIRPCPVGVQVQYWGDSVSDDDFIAAICDGGLKAIQSINCVQHARFRLVPAYRSNASCTDEPDTGTGCDGSVSLINDDCPCASDCPSGGYGNCPTLESWQYPVFVSAELMGERC
jgi:hypothetical protein